MTGNEHDPISDDEAPYSRWEDFKQRLITDWRRDDFGRHSVYWSVIVFVGIMGYGLLFK